MTQPKPCDCRDTCKGKGTLPAGQSCNLNQRLAKTCERKAPKHKEAK